MYIDRTKTSETCQICLRPFSIPVRQKPSHLPRVFCRMGPSSPHTAYRPGHRRHFLCTGRSKRRRTRFREERPNVEVFESFEDSEDHVPLGTGQEEKVTTFYMMAFKRLQPINCRYLAKKIIKIIEHREQVRPSYNGGRRPGGTPSEMRGPEDTES
jgi:hypothetical protein